METRYCKGDNVKQHFPKWEDLPELDLYLDQVLLYVNQTTQSLRQDSDKGLTASMINNYVKHGLVDKPIKKKYNRQQLARLIAITVFKPVFSIQEFSHAVESLTKAHDSQSCYDAFVDCMNHDNPAKVPDLIHAACQTLELYHHTYHLVNQLEGGQS